MRERTINIIILILIFISCKNKAYESKPENSITTSDLKERIEPEVTDQGDTIKLTSESTDNIVDFLSVKYSKVYEYQGTDSRQLIGINFITKDSIDYYLSSETMPCDTEYFGKAFNQNYDLDPEIDEDENGISYAANQYSDKREDYLINIRIALDSSKVKIGYTDNKTDGTDCAPNTISVMKEIK